MHKSTRCFRYLHKKKMPVATVFQGWRKLIVEVPNAIVFISSLVFLSRSFFSIFALVWSIFFRILHIWLNISLKNRINNWKYGYYKSESRTISYITGGVRFLFTFPSKPFKGGFPFFARAKSVSKKLQLVGCKGLQLRYHYSIFIIHTWKKKSWVTGQNTSCL